MFFIEENVNFIYNQLFCFNHTCYYVGKVSVTSTSRYQCRSSMYIRRFIQRNWPVPIAGVVLVNGMATCRLGRNSLSSLTVDKNIKLGWKELNSQVIVLVDCISTVR